MGHITAPIQEYAEIPLYLLISFFPFLSFIPFLSLLFPFLPFPKTSASNILQSCLIKIGCSFCVFETNSHYSIAQTCPEFTILLPQPSGSSAYRHESPRLVCLLSCWLSAYQRRQVSLFCPLTYAKSLDQWLAYSRMFDKSFLNEQIPIQKVVPFNDSVFFLNGWLLKARCAGFHTNYFDGR